MLKWTMMFGRADLIGIVDIAAKLGAILATLSLVMSVVYDWAYLWELGLGFSDIPTSLTDHARTALIWLPPTAITVAVLFAIETHTRVIERWMTEEEIVASSRNPVRTRWLRKSPWVLLTVFACSHVVLYGLFGDRFRTGLVFSILVIWSQLLWWLITHRTTPRAAVLGILTVSFVTTALGLVFIRGQEAARKDLVRKSPSHTIVLRGVDSIALKVTLIRPFERGVLVRSVDEPVVQFVRWDGIERIVAAEPDPPFQGVVCGWWRRFCADPSR